MNQELTEHITRFLIPKLDPVFIIVFGSYAKDMNRIDSDLDIAFFCQNPTKSPYELFMLAGELANIINTDVDLVNLHEVSTVFKAQIYSSGVCIYSKNDTFFYQQRMTALSMYVKLNEERKMILDQIAESGVIYEK
ncbi:type VII toxin-antitoxin system MntA family adenylyltransferase antitoxin [Alkalihalobacillus pseudalcaliphilus]|uniref:type VII toxin-antitoxin system MntA family adenylyltransferase antitoxin n=1 Tax=Alkalihalobacillus pseudalcaliphilus TaxID=79884 RepID=UPI00064D93A0|nr:nucleotidyltransferase domain-containing protein [Alkalihalobacillus pseudalcaliphilus]KMK74359.1 DNA polymerase subunit beta [Alkalihalobacillus pseudalcaliphilus]